MKETAAFDVVAPFAMLWQGAFCLPVFPSQAIKGEMEKMNRSNKKVARIAVIGLMAALASALMFLETRLPFLPPFLQLDISGVPILITSFFFGPLAGLATTAVKALVHLSVSSTGGVGEIADFIITGSMAVVAGLVYRRNKTRKGAVLGSAAGVVVMTVLACLMNYFVLFPFYGRVMNLTPEMIIGICNAALPFVEINSLLGCILLGVFPFNLVKGFVVSTLTFLLYKRVSAPLHRMLEIQSPVAEPKG